MTSAPCPVRARESRKNSPRRLFWKGFCAKPLIDKLIKCRCVEDVVFENVLPDSTDRPVGAERTGASAFKTGSRVRGTFRRSCTSPGQQPCPSSPTCPMVDGADQDIAAVNRPELREPLDQPGIGNPGLPAPPRQRARASVCACQVDAMRQGPLGRPPGRTQEPVKAHRRRRASAATKTTTRAPGATGCARRQPPLPRQRGRRRQAAAAFFFGDRRAILRRAC